MDVTPDQLLKEIGRLHVANAVLTEQIAAAKTLLLKQANRLEDNPPGETPGEAVPN